MNSTIVLNRLVAARNEGGAASAVTAATALVNQYYPGRTFDVAGTVNAALASADRFDRAGAETVINEALATLARPEPVVAADAAVATDTTNHEARIAALETIARNRGLLGYATGGSVEDRIVRLETLARDNGLV